MTDRVVAWFEKHARDLPWRQEPDCKDPYAVYVSEVMLQQTQVKTVIPYWERWMERLPTIQDLASSDEEQVLKLWEGLGYYTRVRNMQRAARLVVERHAGVFPRSFEDVLALPGIGRYTAGAICSIAFGQPTPILDGNLIRVLTRVFAIEGDPKSKAVQDRLWRLSENLVSEAAHEDACSSLNQGLMELGATICLPRDPICSRCPLQRECIAFQTNSTANYPQTAARSKPRQRRFVALILKHGSKVLVRKRSADVVNANLWEFPNFELLEGKSIETKKRWAHLKVRPFATIKHTITNNRITLRALEGRIDNGPETVAAEFLCEWRELHHLERLPFSSAHSKLRSLLGAAPEG